MKGKEGQKNDFQLGHEIWIRLKAAKSKDHLQYTLLYHWSKRVIQKSESQYSKKAK